MGGVYLRGRAGFKAPPYFSEGADGCRLRAWALCIRRTLMREFEDGGERNTGGLVREEKTGGVTRREFLEMGVAATLAGGGEKGVWAAGKRGELLRRALGRTGE